MASFLIVAKHYGYKPFGADGLEGISWENYVRLLLYMNHAVMQKNRSLAVPPDPRSLRKHVFSYSR